MYKILKVLNNNALLIQSNHQNLESIFLGKGIGFGKRNGDFWEPTENTKEFILESSDGRTASIGTKNGIEPIYLEVAGKIIEEAQNVFEGIRTDILLPLADHIAFAAKRQREKIYIANPFIPDIKVLFGKEYTIAQKCKEIILEMAGYQISDDEVGFIALHIHSGLTHEHVSDTMRDTQTIANSMKLISSLSEEELDVNSLPYIRLMSHLYYLIMRTRTKEAVNLDLNDYMEKKYPYSTCISKKVCSYIQEQIGYALDEQEVGYLAVHIQRLLNK